jgi:transketolase
MAVSTEKHMSLKLLEQKAIRLRIDSIRATTAAGSGHPTSCASAAEIVSALFFSVMRYDPKNPHGRNNDVFVLSKGHAAPVLYAAWAEAGAIPRERLLTLRKIDSDLEGHPTPRLSFVDAATGSLGQGLSAGVGIALNAKELDETDQRVYVLMGDGESAEGAVWEAAQMASQHRLNNLCATIDINRLGQSQHTMLEHHLEIYKARWESFGWQAIPVDGHNLAELLDAYDRAQRATDRPSIVLARTHKGRGIPGIEDKNGWHGKPLDKETEEKAVQALEQALGKEEETWTPNLPSAMRTPSPDGKPPGDFEKPPYSPDGKEVATRKAFGEALAAAGKTEPRIVVIDGDVKNSTYTEEFEKAFPKRFFEGFIAEQNMVGMAMGFAARGKIPFVSTFACFLSRAYDFVRMAAISQLNVKFAGTHVGVSIGDDGPSQMGLEDIAMFGAQPNFTVLYPSDAVSAWQSVALLAQHTGPGYLRLGRPNSPILYNAEERFETGKCKVLRQSDQDKVLVVAGGVTVFEALEAYDQLKQQNISIRVIDLFSIQPIDADTLKASASAVGNKVLTVEDHYAHGGLGDAVLAALADHPATVRKLAVREIPRSGKPKELLEKFGISASHIVSAVKEMAG